MVPFLKGEAEKGKGVNYEVSFEDSSSWIPRTNVCDIMQMCHALESNKEAKSSMSEGAYMEFLNSY